MAQEADTPFIPKTVAEAVHAGWTLDYHAPSPTLDRKLIYAYTGPRFGNDHRGAWVTGAPEPEPFPEEAPATEPLSFTQAAHDAFQAGFGNPPTDTDIAITISPDWLPVIEYLRAAIVALEGLSEANSDFDRTVAPTIKFLRNELGQTLADHYIAQLEDGS